jgi:DNA modification methylase
MSNESERLSSQPNEEETLLTRLGDLLRLDDDRWQVGDVINDLRARYEWTFERLAERFDYSRSRLIQFATVAAAFPPEARTVNVPFVIYEYGRLASERVAREVGLHTGVEVEPDFVGDLQFIADERERGQRLTDQRAVTAALAKRARPVINGKTSSADAIHQAQNAPWLNQCHNKPNAEVIAKLADASVKMFHFDPPFGVYRKITSGVLDVSTSVGLTDCDNNDRERAVAVTVEAIRAAVPKLVPNGVILLWQASSVIASPIASVIEELGLGGVPFIIWNKRRPKLGDGAEGIQYSTEVCYVLVREDEKPLQHDLDVPKGQVIDDIPPLNFRTENIIQHHQMEKPVALSERLLRQFSREGDIVVDGFGCSGSFCVAAQGLGRNWIYCESNLSNFHNGLANIGRSIERTGTVA